MSSRDGSILVFPLAPSVVLLAESSCRCLPHIDQNLLCPIEDSGESSSHCDTDLGEERIKRIELKREQSEESIRTDRRTHDEQERECHEATLEL